MERGKERERGERKREHGEVYFCSAYGSVRRDSICETVPLSHLHLSGKCTVTRSPPSLSLSLLESIKSHVPRCRVRCSSGISSKHTRPLLSLLHYHQFILKVIKSIGFFSHFWNRWLSSASPIEATSMSEENSHMWELTENTPLLGRYSFLFFGWVRLCVLFRSPSERMDKEWSQTRKWCALCTSSWGIQRGAFLQLKLTAVTGTRFKLWKAQLIFQLLI